MTYTVYRVYPGDESELLYVGMTTNVDRRLRQHAATKPWWPEVPTIATEVFEDMGEAADREMDVVIAESPKHNGGLHRYPAKPKSSDLEVQTCVRIPSALRQRIQAKAKKEDRTEAWVIRRALYLYVDGRGSK